MLPTRAHGRAGVQCAAMVVSHRHRFVFFAVPRTGTHAIRAALQPVLGEEDWQQGRTRWRCAAAGARACSPGATATSRYGKCRAASLRTSGVAISSSPSSATPYDRFVSVCAMLNKRNPGYAGGERSFMKRGARGAAVPAARAGAPANGIAHRPDGSGRHGFRRSLRDTAGVVRRRVSADRHSSRATRGNERPPSTLHPIRTTMRNCVAW